MKRIDVKTPNGTYPIEICENLCAQVGPRIRDLLKRTCAAIVVTNPTVGEHYLEPVVSSLKGAGFQADAAEIPDGEQYKTLETIEDIYDRFLEVGLDRSGVVIALGGGVVGDMAGYAAATYMRGVPFVQMPTTLLAMVDASVGGKTGVDLPQGKNLVGAFKQPEGVLIDPSVLATLPGEELSVGMAEVIKHGLIGNADLFERLERETPTDLAALVDEAVRVKVNIVERDPFEKGDRVLLNLGHTFAHAFELLSDFQLKHGAAVAVGLVASAVMGTELLECDASLVHRVENAVIKQGLPTRMSGFDVDEVVGAMRHDKKRADGLLRFIVPRAPGETRIVTDVEDVIVRATVAKVLAS
ncbi:MAG: 3-dehydroquinate synthase [Deltaproteobacteria bacterium]|nr:3-dehydroquinate synthase [Deltaproteobacteria bacterium]